MPAVVELRGVTKRFGQFTANDHISLIVEKGEIHALLGENGAGKSTLMNILFGLYEPDEGEILIRGERVVISDPNMANRLGIGMVHQHFMLVGAFTVTENIILGLEPTRGGRLDVKRAEREVQELSDRYGLKVNPGAKISEVSVGMQQRVEILKTLYRGAEILIFDEPTAVLTPQEIHELMEIMRKLIAEGKTIIFITHKLKEIKQVCHRVSVIRRGRLIETVEVNEVTTDELAAKMVGRHVTFAVSKGVSQPKQKVLEIKNLTVEGHQGVNVLQGLNLDVRAGEIVGIAGIEGNGQSELIEAITGLQKIKTGEINLNGKAIQNLPPRAITELGVGHIPEDRHKRGLVLDYTIGENMVLLSYYKAPFSKQGFLNYGAIYEYAHRLIEQFDVRTPSEHIPARALSGGNQQKAIIAREVNRSPELLIAAQPTRGLDVGAIEFIHQKLIEQRDAGRAVLLLSFELDEILSVSDRIIVIYEGQIVGNVSTAETNHEALGLMMAGGRRS